MNSKGTFYLTVLALGIFTYIFLFERHTLDTEQRAERDMKLLPDFDAGKVSSVEILRPNSVIHVDRTNGQWRLTRPTNYPAQTTMIENWLGLFNSLNRRAYISAEELQEQAGGLAAFGLEEPQAIVIIQHGQKKLRLRLGAKTPIGEKLYLQQVGSDGVYVTESALLDRLPPAATDWRDPVFLRLQGLKFDRLQVHVRDGAREFAVERDPTTTLWRLVNPRPARVDNGVLQQLLQQLQNVRVGQFVTDAPGSDLEPYGLQTPSVTLAFNQGTNNVLTVEFGQSPANNPAQVYARRSNYPTITTVPKQLVDVLRAPYTDFLDKRLIEFTPGAVDRIEAQAAESFALQKQTNGAWRIIEPFDAPADPALVHEFFNRLNSLQIVDLAKEVVTVEDLPTYGLAAPERQYILKGPEVAGGTNAMIARIDFGTNQADRIFVRRADENSVYQTRLQDSLELPQAAIELRDRRIWDFTTNQVAGVTIEFRGKVYKLQRSGSGKWGFPGDATGIMMNTFALEEAMFRFGKLWSKAWIARGQVEPARYGFTQPPHKLSIDVNTGDKTTTLTVEFGGQSLSGGPYAVVNLQEAGRTVFECPFKIYDAYSEVVRSLIASVGATP